GGCVFYGTKGSDGFSFEERFIGGWDWGLGVIFEIRFGRGDWGMVLFVGGNRFVGIGFWISCCGLWSLI
ncbi:hypothetical protein, partial [Paenibacillus sp. Y412MC10]|uniref:hypothetical protein n=1 Tax=Geobacillus sp. (strain Y412MC10) TaxID=481743 RepID=UPI001C930387